MLPFSFIFKAVFRLQETLKITLWFYHRASASGECPTTGTSFLFCCAAPGTAQLVLTFLALLKVQLLQMQLKWRCRCCGSICCWWSSAIITSYWNSIYTCSISISTNITTSLTSNGMMSQRTDHRTCYFYSMTARRVINWTGVKCFTALQEGTQPALHRQQAEY